MKYYYEPPGEWSHKNWCVYYCNHPMYKRCTLYRHGELGLAVVQKRFDAKTRSIWWGSVDPPIAYDISIQDGFWTFFNDCATLPDRRGNYYTVSLRKIMWALRMKPLRKEFWEEEDFNIEKSE